VKPVECEREAEVLAAVLQSRWPDRVDDSLRAHVAACAICADVTAIAGGIDEDRELMRVNAVLPDSGRVWWVAQMRARREAATAAGRPITAAQVAAFACAMGLLGACFGATSPWFQTLLQKVQEVLPAAMALFAGHGLLILAMVGMLVILPAAIYLTVLRD
jgi:hypothetical protein